MEIYYSMYEIMQEKFRLKLGIESVEFLSFHISNQKKRESRKRVVNVRRGPNLKEICEVEFYNHNQKYSSYWISIYLLDGERRWGCTNKASKFEDYTNNMK